ncbi:MAG: hypothetical protein DME56_04755 [Verrucomicrobia bacterium]|nr:MAG: hypothetical protein DME56_04755 [Verrucomicrobiota bacterium]
MTKTELSVEVFSGTPSSAEIDEALRLFYTGYTWSVTEPKPPAALRFNAGFSQRKSAKKANKVSE